MTPNKRVEPLYPEAALFVAVNMRKIDREEIFATRWNEDLDDLVEDCMACAPVAWVYLIDETPVSVFGAAPHHPGVWSVWMFATDQWPSAYLGVTRFMKRAMFPALVDVGAHRIFCASLDKHVEAHKWLEKAFDARKEAVNPGFGRRRETFFTFAWTAPDVPA